jgi:hypothetical protein
MHKSILFAIYCLLLIGCSIKEKPEFLAIDNFTIESYNSKYIVVRANALFNNPNNINGKLTSDGIKVFINDVEMAQVSSVSFDVPAKKNFKIPLLVNIPTDSIISNKSLEGLLGSLFSEKLKVQYKGDLKYKVFGFSHIYPVDKTEDIKLKF